MIQYSIHPTTILIADTNASTYPWHNGGSDHANDLVPLAVLFCQSQLLRSRMIHPHMYALFHLLKRNKPKEISPKETCPSLESYKTLGETKFTISINNAHNNVAWLCKSRNTNEGCQHGSH
jgi:hypothetical protein